MASYARRTRVTTYTEYLLPAGTVVGELLKAVRAAWAEHCSQTGYSADANMPDDWAQVVIDDENVIIRITTDVAKP